MAGGVSVRGGLNGGRRRPVEIGPLGRTHASGMSVLVLLAYRSTVCSWGVVGVWSPCDATYWFSSALRCSSGFMGLSRYAQTLLAGHGLPRVPRGPLRGGSITERGVGTNRQWTVWRIRRRHN